MARDLPADVSCIFTAISLIPLTPGNLPFFLECLVKRQDFSDWAMFASVCLVMAVGATGAVMEAKLTQLSDSLMPDIVPVAVPIFKRCSRLSLGMPHSQYKLLGQYISTGFQNIVQCVRWHCAPHQIGLLKVIRYLAYVMTPVLTTWSAIMVKGAVLAKLRTGIRDSGARREFARLAVKSVQEALAHPALTPPAMIKKRVDIWVGVYSSALEIPVKFIEVEPHLRFAIALSACQSVRYPTGSFWFAILNKLVEWDRNEFIEQYFKAIVGNGVDLFDKQVIVQFVNEMKEDEMLVGKLSVLKVIMVMLKGNEVLREALKDTYDTLGPLASVVGGDDSLIDAILEAMADPD
jgi:hypothetical protein